MRMYGLAVVTLLGVLVSACGESAHAAQLPPPPPRPAVEIDSVVAAAEAQYARGEYEPARAALYALHDELVKSRSPKADEVRTALDKAACALQLPEAATYFKAWPAKRRALEKESVDGSTYTSLMVDLAVTQLYLKCVQTSPADVLGKLVPERQRTPAFLATVNKDLARFIGKADKIKAYFDSCGEKPGRWFDGGVVAAESLMKKNAHDPDSIDVENCTEPVLMTRGCWQYTCDVRGKNAFGALILNHQTFHQTATEISTR